MQGGQLAICNGIDIINIIMAHHKMTALRAEASTAFVQRETGAVAGVARAMHAATAPTEGQRMLQAGYHGAILGGESREQSRTTTDAEGNVRVERFVERSVLGEDGRPILLQQAQQCVGGGGGHMRAKEMQAPVEMATMAPYDAVLVELSMIKGDMLTMQHLDAVKADMVTKTQHETDMSNKASKQVFDFRVDEMRGNFTVVAQNMGILRDHMGKIRVYQDNIFDAKLEEVKKVCDHKHDEAMKENDAQRQQDKKDADAQREEDKKDANAQREQDKLENDAMKAKMELLEATVKSLASGQAKASKRAQQHKAPKEPAPKQPRLYWNKEDHPELPRNIFYRDGSFGWKKTTHKKQAYKAGFKSIAEAQASLALHLNGGGSRDIAEMMGGV